MSIDMSQFLQTFYEESFEGLEIMESELLNLDVGSADPETINTIFRAAHSIKGGSGTFGLTAVAAFTHVMETLLDQMRDGQREVTQEAVNILLESVDVLREMLSALQNDQELDTNRIAEAQQKLDDLLAGAAGSTVVAPVASSETNTNASSGWHVKFKPNPDMMLTGNDPVRMIRELDSLGELQVVADLSQLPEFEQLQPENSYLSWDLIITGEIESAQIKEIFEWVEDECELSIEPLESISNLQPEDKDRQQPTQPTAAETTIASKAVSSVTSNQSGSDTAAPVVKPVANVTKEKKKAPSSEASSIRVSIEKVDELINMVGELVITQSMLSQLGQEDEFKQHHIDKLRDGLAQLERNTRELQENAMRIRMLPISFVFQRFPRLVHDLSGKLSKKIELKLSGEQTELDKTVLEKIGDPLVHLVRNSLDHGIESPEKRKQAGKPETGIIHLNAFHEGGNIIIEITDDGAGLNRDKILAKARKNGLVSETEELSVDQIHDLIFKPGFSTADVVSDVSGRGVGMDVVRRNIRSLGGTVEVVSEPGKGSTFRIRLPLTLAILDGQSVSVGSENYIVPLVSIIESIQVQSNLIYGVAGQTEVYKLRDEYIPIVQLWQVFGVEPVARTLEDGLLVVVEAEGQKVALFVDDLLGQQQVVIKSLETNFRKVDGISGATILGDGTVALILDIAGLINLSKIKQYQKRPRKNNGDSSVAA